MAHRLATDRPHRIVDDIVDVGRLRMHALGSGDTVVLTADEATRDGSPVLGGIAVVRWGESAIFRVAGERLAVAWEERGDSVQAVAGDECRLCGGEFDVPHRERAEACACGVRFHVDCWELVVTCQECGRTTGGG